MTLAHLVQHTHLDVDSVFSALETSYTDSCDSLKHNLEIKIGKDKYDGIALSQPHILP